VKSVYSLDFLDVALTDLFILIILVYIHRNPSHSDHSSPPPKPKMCFLLYCTWIKVLVFEEEDDSTNKPTRYIFIMMTIIGLKWVRINTNIFVLTNIVNTTYFIWVE
jgi:hypothetical protein